MHPLFKQRHSGYGFDKTKPVSDLVLKEILEAARSAPSCYGDEPWRYIICRKDARGYAEVLESLVKPNYEWAKDAPILIVAIADYIFSKTGKHNRWASHDTGAASAYLSLQATASGLMAHQMGGFNGPAIIQHFKLPDECIPVAIIALGYEKLPIEEKKKSRRPFSFNFYEGEWKKGIKL